MPATVTDTAAGLTTGEGRRDAGMMLAAARRQRLIWQSQLALLDAILARPDRTATTDDATADLWQPHPDGGHWRGSVPRDLAARGLIVRAGVVQSARPSRHAGWVAAWRGLDDAALDAHRRQLRAWLAAAPADREPVQRELW